MDYKAERQGRDWEYDKQEKKWMRKSDATSTVGVEVYTPEEFINAQD